MRADFSLLKWGYYTFGAAILIVSSAALIHQFAEVYDYDTIPDLFIGTDCDVKPLLSISPEVKGRDIIDIFYPFEQQMQLGDGGRAWDKRCTRLILFSHEKIENFGSSEIEVKKVALQGLGLVVYVASVDLAALARSGDNLRAMASITFPSHWPRSSRDTKTFRLYLPSDGLFSRNPEISKAFGKDEIANVVRSSFDLAISGDLTNEVISSFPSIDRASVVRHTGAFKSPPMKYEAIIPVNKNAEAIVLTVRDNSMRARREVMIVIVSTFVGLGLALVVETFCRI